MSKPVLCLGLTPALQRVLCFEGFSRGEVNRVKTVRSAAAGKAINTAKVLSRLGIPSILCGFNGGSVGDKLHEFLAGVDVEDRMTRTVAETRICTTLIAGGEVTELVEEASAVTSEEIRALEQTVLEALPETTALVIAGTLPCWLPVHFYARFVATARSLSIPVFIDSHRSPLQETLSARPYFVKMNRRELALTECSAEDIIRRGAKNVLITDGPYPAELHTADGVRVLKPPVLSSVVNPIGSGDSVTAGVVRSILIGKTLEEACIVGLACGAANALSLLPGEFTSEQLASLLEGKTI